MRTSATVKTPATDWREAGGGKWERTDDWGNTWARVDQTSQGEVVRGVLEDLADIDRCRFPDYSNPKDYDGVRKIRRKHPDKWLIGGLPGFAFNIARKLRRLDQYLVDILLEPKKIHRLHDRLDDLLTDMIRQYAEAGADAIMFPEDWGTQLQTLISPSLWRREFFPRFRRLCGLSHELGMAVFMHSCGQIGAIIPGLMEAGIDVLQFDQPDLHGIDALAAHQDRGTITFWCPVDIQKTLQTGDEDTIRARAREMILRLWRGRGGFIAGFYSDMPSIGVREEWQGWACEEFLHWGTQTTFNRLFYLNNIPM
jgi:uroporphyrinogen-III decarboxylase